MGTCTSKDGHDAWDTPQHKKPHSKKHKNGQLAIHIEYSPTHDHEIPDKLSCFGDDEDETGKENENEGKIKDTVNEKPVRVVPLITSNIGVAPSDSGIESLSPSEIDHVEKPVLFIDEDNEKTLTASVATNDCRFSSPGDDCLNISLRSHETSNQCSCDSDGPWKLRQNSHGECHSQNSSPSKRFSDIIVLKSRLKQKSDKTNDRMYRLSMKSTDSLDWTATLLTSLDRCHSEASDMFGDDLSIRAPLAEFDSLDFLGSTDDVLASKSKRGSKLLGYNSETFKFQFDFSGLDVKEEQLGCSSSPNNHQPEESAASVSPESVQVDIPYTSTNSKRASRDLR